MSLQTALQSAGMSPVGAQQFVNGLPIGSAADRQSLAALLAALLTKRDSASPLYFNANMTNETIKTVTVKFSRP